MEDRQYIERSLAELADKLRGSFFCEIDKGQKVVSPIAIFLKEPGSSEEIAMVDMPTATPIRELMEMFRTIKDRLRAKGSLLVVDMLAHRPSLTGGPTTSTEAVFTFMATEWGFKEVTITPYIRLQGKAQILPRIQDPQSLVLLNILYNVDTGGRSGG